MKRLPWSLWMRRRVVVALAVASCAAAVFVPAETAAAGSALPRAATAVSAVSSSTAMPDHATGDLLATLRDPGPTAGWFGLSVAVSGSTAIVGAPKKNSNAGTAYIYVKGASGWPTKPTVALNDPMGPGSDSFGYSVAVSQTTAIVGAMATNSDAGTAYIYEKGASGWPTKPTVTLNDPAAPGNDNFGFSVAVSGNTAIVGAPASNSFAGNAYIYEKGASGWPTTPTATLNDPVGAYDQFGYSVAVSGTTAVVGALFTSSHVGAAYIYVKGASGWPTKPAATLNDPVAAGGNDFDRSVAISGTTAIIGAPLTQSTAETSYVFVRSAPGWPTNPTMTLNDPAAGTSDQFGYSVSLSGTTAIVGALDTNSGAGAAYIYRTTRAAQGPAGPIVSGYNKTKCVTDSNDSAANDTKTVIADCNATAGQNWTIGLDGTIGINGKCMDIYRDEKTNKAPVELWTCTGGANQQWHALNGTLVNPVSRKCLDDPRFNITDGTQLEIYTCNGGRNQQWKLP